MKRAGFPACFFLGPGWIKHLILDMADEVFCLIDHQLIGLLGGAAEIGTDEMMTLQLAVDALADATSYPILPTFALRFRIDQKPLMLYGFNRGT